MGIEIEKIDFDAGDFSRFRTRLDENLQALSQVLQRPRFGVGEATLGAELEMYIVDGNGHPLHANQEILRDAADPTLTLELNRYNLEYNLPYHRMGERPFSGIEADMLSSLQRLGAVAANHGGRIVPIGILPTLRESDFGAGCITDRRRYHALVAQLIRRRGGSFQIEIAGTEPLRIEMNDITLEGANTSFQIHYRVAPDDYADTFNAIQLATPLALAIAANSPTLFGHSLWQETRIPLFKQSIDTRRHDPYGCNEPPRVGFGLGWVRRGAEELFREVASVYEPLLPVCSAQVPREQLAAGQVPSLAELRLHQSTVWLWNRPIYDDAGGGHLRIEMRALPAGPTPLDMAANAALLLGLAEGLRPWLPQLLPAIPFQYAQYNFYRAAQFGLDAQLVWPEHPGQAAREMPVTRLLERLLPIAGQGLASIGIGSDESEHYLGVIAERLARRQSGAVWQRHTLEALRRDMPLHEALHAMLERFIEYSGQNLPVSRWPL